MSRPYQSSLFACFSPIDLCLKAACCPCVVYGKNHYRATHGTEQGYSTVNGWCGAWCGLAFVGHWGWILQFIDRRDTQEKYGLEGSSLGACCTSWCCTCCELIQTSKELDYVQVSQNPGAAGYKQEPGMVAHAVHPDGPNNTSPHKYAYDASAQNPAVVINDHDAPAHPSHV